MPGVRNMVIGAVTALLGGVLTAVLVSISPGRAVMVPGGAIVIGGIQFLAGLFQFVAYHLKRFQSKSSVQSPNPTARNVPAELNELTARAALRAMMLAAIADGVLDETEVRAIASIYEKVVGRRPRDQWVRETAHQILNNPKQTLEDLMREGSSIDPAAVPQIFKAACMVASADGKMTEEEGKVLHVISTSMGMSGRDVDKAFEELTAP